MRRARSAPGTYPIILAPLPGGFADAGDENQNPPTLAYAPAKASASPRDGSLFVQPSRIVVGSSFVNQKMKVVSGDASLVPVAFAAAEATARGFVPSGVRCVVGGASDVVGRLSDSDDAALDALRDALVASCDGAALFGGGHLRPGFTVVHVAWVPGAGRDGGTRNGVADSELVAGGVGGEVMVAERPEASTSRPDATLASGGSVVFVSGANFVDFDVLASGGALSCAFGSGSNGRVAVDVGDGAWVSSALVRCEAPPSADASASSRASLEPVTITTAVPPFSARGIFADQSGPLARSDGNTPDRDPPDGESPAGTDDQSAFIARVRAAPSVRAVRPGTVAEGGGDAVVFSLGASLPRHGSGGRCSCQFGTIVRIATSSCWGGEARCVAPAMRPARGVKVGFCSHDPASMACSGVWDGNFLDVAAGSGSAEHAVPSTAASSVGGGAVAVGVRVSLHGWGLRRDSVRSGGVVVVVGVGVGGGASDPLRRRHRADPRRAGPGVRDHVLRRPREGRLRLPFATPAGFHVVTLHSSLFAGSDETTFGNSGNFGGGSRFDDRVGGGVQMLVRGAPRLRAAYRPGPPPPAAASSTCPAETCTAIGPPRISPATSAGCARSAASRRPPPAWYRPRWYRARYRRVRAGRRRTAGRRTGDVAAPLSVLTARRRRRPSRFRGVRREGRNERRDRASGIRSELEFVFEPLARRRRVALG